MYEAWFDSDGKEYEFQDVIKSITDYVDLGGTIYVGTTSPQCKIVCKINTEVHPEYTLSTGAQHCDAYSRLLEHILTKYSFMNTKNALSIYSKSCESR